MNWRRFERLQKKIDRAVGIERPKRTLVTNPDQDKLSIVRGQYSETLVREHLEKQPNVLSIIPMPSKNPEFDFLVDVIPSESRFDGAIQQVELEVKSNQSGIENYKTELQKRHSVRPKDLDGWLLQHRRIIISADNEGRIVNSFGFQLRRIRKYHRPRRKYN